MDVRRRQIQIYQDQRGNEPFIDWISSLTRSYRARVLARIDRVETGNLGDCKHVGEGVFELRLHFGSGYRVYFGEVGDTIVLLLCGGEKSSQTKDIQQAKAYWKSYTRRNTP
jgi:putative addiction module killer protein